MISGWRIAAPLFASSVEEMLSGEGALLAGGRWNSKGIRVVYLGNSIAQAAMELLVHLHSAQVLNSYYQLEVSFSEDCLEHIALDDLPADWAEPTMAPSVQAVGDAWIASGSSLVLQVPSAAVKGEYNYLLNPRHPDFAALAVGQITPFNFDARILKR